MADGASTLGAWAARLRTLGPDVVRDAAPKVRAVVERELRGTIARGQSAEGVRHQRTKDGRTPLTGAAAALNVSVVGTAVVATLTGPEARHHKGAVRGGVRRPILPTGAPPASMARGIREALGESFRAKVGGAR